MMAANAASDSGEPSVETRIFSMTSFTVHLSIHVEQPACQRKALRQDLETAEFPPPSRRFPRLFRRLLPALGWHRTCAERSTRSIEKGARYVRAEDPDRAGRQQDIGVDPAVLGNPACLAGCE